MADMLYGMQASGDTQLSSIMRATGGKGTIVYDRGGDRPVFYGAFIENRWNFIIRMKSRCLLSWKGLREVRDLASQCTMRHHHHVEFNSQGEHSNIPISFGAMPVRLPMHPEKELHMVVIRGFGEAPMTPPTSLPVSRTLESMWRVAEAYLSRWDQTRLHTLREMVPEDH